MSRGPGHVERQILDFLSHDVEEAKRLRWPSSGQTSAEIAQAVYGAFGKKYARMLGVPELTDAQLGSVRRALRRLEQRGLVSREQRDYRGKSELRWKLVGRGGSGRRRSGGDEATGFAGFRSDGFRSSGFAPDVGPRPPDTLTGRFAKVLGMLGSDHDGERASAALAADKLRKQSGLTWAEIIRENVQPKRAARRSAPNTRAKPSAQRAGLREPGGIGERA